MPPLTEATFTSYSFKKLQFSRANDSNNKSALLIMSCSFFWYFPSALQIQYKWWCLQSAWQNSSYCSWQISKFDWAESSHSSSSLIIVSIVVVSLIVVSPTLLTMTQRIHTGLVMLLTVVLYSTNWKVMHNNRLQCLTLSGPTFWRAWFGRFWLTWKISGLKNWARFIDLKIWRYSDFTLSWLT